MTKITKGSLKPVNTTGKAQDEATKKAIEERIIQAAAQKRTEVAQACIVAACQGAGDALKDADSAALVAGAFAIADAYVLKAYNVTFKGQEGKA